MGNSTATIKHNNNNNLNKSMNIQNTENIYSCTPNTFLKIGSGPLLDRENITKWINASGKTTPWITGDGKPIDIDTAEYKNIQGFMPPAFTYYPEGMSIPTTTTNEREYTKKNYENGRALCQSACKDTNCVAVQTEIPENCSQKASGCGDLASYSCTLFYSNIDSADHSYWQLSKGSGCGLDTIHNNCLGKKFYEDAESPVSLPGNAEPGDMGTNIRFCNNTDTNTDFDTCVARDLLTTEYIQKKRPFYNVPINMLIPMNAIKEKSGGTGYISGSTDMVVPSVQIDPTGNKSCCGLCGDKMVSCTGNQCPNNSMIYNNCWRPANNSLDKFVTGFIEKTGCDGDGISSIGIDAIAASDNWKNSGDQENYTPLLKSCYYRHKATKTLPVQFNCDINDTNPDRGCVGTAPILFTDTLGSEYGACRSILGANLIPESQRCIDPDPSKTNTNSALLNCKGFPYSCESVEGSNNLFKNCNYN